MTADIKQLNISTSELINMNIVSTNTEVIWAFTITDKVTCEDYLIEAANKCSYVN